MEVRELYLTDGNIKDSHYVFMVMGNGTVKLIWYLGDTKYDEPFTTLIRNKDGSMKIEYGDKNVLGQRRILNFTDNKGNIDPRWTKIK